MLPNFLQSNYQTYKQDTDSIAKWLAVKAKQCGYPADLLSPTVPPTSLHQPARPSQRLKGAARKKAKDVAKEDAAPLKDLQISADAPKYTIQVKDFVTLAECIARFTKPAVEVPATLARALNRAVELRQQHNTWCRSRVEAERSVDSNKSHAYFLDILERTREILKPRMPPELIDDFLSKPSSNGNGQGNSDTQINGQISNMFVGLDIQEPSQTFLDAPDVKQETGNKAVPEPTYEAEKLRSTEEQYLAAHCLFQDVRNIRSFLRQLWANYRDGGLSLVAVSITTNTAIDFVRSMEQDCLQRFPEKSDYESIMHIFYSVQCLHRGHDPSSKQQSNDLFNFEVYDLAEEVMVPTYIVLEGLQRIISPDSVPIYKPGHFGARDMRNDWTKKSARDKVHDDSLVLMEAFPDLMLMTMITSKSPLAEDELIRGIRQMAPGRLIPLWLVFAAQCFLDAQHVLGRDVARGHAELQQTANAIRASISQNFDFHKSLRVENWPRQNDFQLNESLRVIEEWIRHDMVADKMKAVKAAVTLPPPEPFRLLKQYPLICGLFSFAIQKTAQEVGIAFANAWGSIMYTGHLYNAIRQEKFLSKAWKDMELLIALQSTEKFFVGDPPKDLEGYLKRFLLSVAYSATAFARNRRRGAAIASAKGPRALSELCAVGALFKGRYCQNQHTVTWTPDGIKPIIEAKIEDDSESENAEKKSTKVKTAASGSLMRKPKSNSGSMPTTDFLGDLANALHAETLEMSVDYLRMHRFCWMLLRNVNDVCKPQLLEMFGPGYLEKENQLPFMVGYIFMAATQTSRVANLLLPRRAGVEVSSRLLARAATALEGMVESGAGEIESKFIAQRLGVGEIDYGELDNLDAHDRT
ncbi:hypothetical protein HO173_006938 [Letharia columbiana]|uniref:DUF6604 domain-containing protein n=1 Tax=Letharia columbiana TaxID=112416 RepID=A0A8H6FUM8_9LECA|nr:uncharacterized protein HO173_006938 [Letharia columbiana]KAF6235008.1 hypothetical protein HO173_006938 [Letharia columbiana]